MSLRLGQELGCEGGFTATDAGELLLSVLLELIGSLLVVGTEGLDARLALPFERGGVLAAGSFSEECHGCDPILVTTIGPFAILGKGGAGVAQASESSVSGHVKCDVSVCSYKVCVRKEERMLLLRSLD